MSETPLVNITNSTTKPSHVGTKDTADAKATTDGSMTTTRAEKEPKEATPYDAYMDKLNAFVKEHGYRGYVLVTHVKPSGGTEEDDSDDEDEDEASYHAKYTEADMNQLRFVLITQSRADKLEEMSELILGPQHGQGPLMFNTSFSYQVLDSLVRFQRLLNKAKTKRSDKIDLAFAYTWTLHLYDVWMHDNEGGMDQLTKKLASIWKRLLKKPSSSIKKKQAHGNDHHDLGLDDRYSTPGLLAFLDQFQTAVESVDTYGYPKMTFHYK